MSVLSVLLATLLPHLGNSQCDTLTSDDIPQSAAVSYPTPQPTGVPRGYSELVKVRQMNTLEDELGDGWDRTNCPWDNPTYQTVQTWSEVAEGLEGTDVTLPSNTSVTLSQCDLDQVSPNLTLGMPYQRITVPMNSELIFIDYDIELHMQEILVEDGGALRIGSETCRVFATIKLVFHGSKSESSISVSDRNSPSKGIISDGILEMHGKQYHPTWDRLARSAEAGSDLVFLQSEVNWEVGQKIMLSTSVWMDCADWFADAWCKPCYSWQTCDTEYHQNEIRTIKAIADSPEGVNRLIQIDEPLNHTHFASKEYQSEVVLLSRRVQIEGSDEDEFHEYFGAHVMGAGHHAEMHISGVSCLRCGQLNILGRYPFHFHLMGNDSNAQSSFFQDCSVLDSFFRAYVIHGTNHTRVSRNTAFNITGFAYYIEDGVEEMNMLEYNFAGFVHPIGRPANGDGQGGESFFQSDDLIIPADASASGFYVSNPHNYFIGNAASGGWSGFAFPNLPYPIGSFHGSNWGNNNPMQRPFPGMYSWNQSAFDGNTAHSAGVYWTHHGSCMYVGARLTQSSDTGELSYTSGRFSRDTRFSDGNEAWQVFVNIKTWLCRQGIEHWGNRLILHNYESHDNLRPAELFGESGWKHGIANARTWNEEGRNQQNFRGSRQGFLFYDTWVKSMLSDIVFRNFTFAKEDGYGQSEAVINYLTHSDEFIPQGINSVQRLSFENVEESIIIRIDDCGEELCGERESMSARISAVFDYDGSLSRTGQSSLVGSHRNWWNFSEGNCEFTEWDVWRCDWNPESEGTVAFLSLNVAGLSDGCEDDFPLMPEDGQCGNQAAPYHTGYVSQFTSDNRSCELSAWGSGIAGVSNRGWNWKPIFGAPNQFRIGEATQIPRERFVVLAVRYPKNTRFTVNVGNTWWNDENGNQRLNVEWPEDDLETVLSENEDMMDVEDIQCDSAENWYDFCSRNETGGVGFAWHFEMDLGGKSAKEGTLYIRVVKMHFYHSNQYRREGNWQFEGMHLWDVGTGFYADFSAECDGCEVSESYMGVDYFKVEDQSVECSMDSIREGLCNQFDNNDSGQQSSLVVSKVAWLALLVLSLTLMF